MGVGIAGAEDGLNIAPAAGARAVLVDGGDVDKGADEGDVEDDGEEGGQCEAGKAAHEQDAQAGVQDGGARDALSRAEVGGDGDVVVGHGGEEVRGQGQNQPRAAELDAAVEPLYDF